VRSFIPVSYQPGDLVFVHSDDFVSRVIRFGQRLRSGWSAGAFWNHVAILDEQVGTTWTVIQATGHGVTQGSTLAQVDPHGTRRIVRLPPGVDRGKLVAFARDQVSDDYGFLTIASIAFNLLTPQFMHLDFRRGGTWICSALAAGALLAGGWWPDPMWRSVYEVTPAQLFLALHRL